MVRVLLFLAAVVEGARVHSTRADVQENSVGGQPNPPVWPTSVQVFGPEDPVSKIQSAVDAAFATNGGHEPPDNGHWSDLRFAFLFKPGKYNVEVPVGYYTQVSGLGENPSDVVFTSPKGVYCDEGQYKVGVGGLNSFWRSAENFKTEADFEWIPNRGGGMTWAASQAAPLRRIEVQNNLILYRFREGEGLGDYVSGGFLGDSKIHGHVFSGSQQQYYTRNSEVGSWDDGNWNMVFMGVKGAPDSHCGAYPSMCSAAVIALDETPSIAEKPFITIGSDGRFTLNVPQFKRGSAGVDVSVGKQIGFDQVYVATDKDSAATINAALDSGNHVVLSPGNYRLTEAIVINKPNMVLLGLGLATLIISNGGSAIEVGNVAGVRIGGILVSAGPDATDTAILVGSSKWAGEASNPVILQDVFIRVGDHTNSGVQAKVMLTINSGHTIGDDVWLWRADHTAQGLVRNGDNPCEVGLVVNGDDVSMLGWSAEHTLHDQVQWNGDRGSCYFLQVELAYDLDHTFTEAGHTGYRVADSVKSHIAYGVGIYHYMRDNPIVVETGIVVPRHLETSFIQPFGVFLNGSGVMNHLINDKGEESVIDPANPTLAVAKWYCENNPSFIDLTSNVSASCSVGQPVKCPDSPNGCAGNSCCQDGSTCPSAHPDFACCPSKKRADCTGGVAPPWSPPGPPAPPPPPPAPVPGDGSCSEGSLTKCPTGNANCLGSQCCPDGSVCPSAPASFTGCPVGGKIKNCL